MKLNYPNYESLSEKLFTENENLKSVYTSYIGCLDNLIKNGVSSGWLHNELVSYKNAVSKVPDLIDAISKKTKALISSYLTDMNNAQKIEGEYILYDECYAGTRDYTAESFESMRRDCDNTDSDANIFETIEDWAEDLISKVFKFLGKKFNWWDAGQTRFLVMEINDITKKQLNSIQTNLKNSEDYYQSNAIALHNCVLNFKNYISILNEVTGSDIKTFSMAPFTLKLDELFTDVVETLDNIYVDEGISWKAVEKFIHTNDVERFFDEYRVVVTDFLADLSSLEMKDMEFWLMTISQLFDVATKQMMGWVKTLFGDDYSYESYLYDNEMMKLFDTMAKNKSFSDSEYKEILSEYKSYMKLMQKYGDDWEKYLTGRRDENGKLLFDKRTKNYKYFKEFFKHFENAENILKYGTDIVEIFAAVTADYEKNLEILNTVIDDCDPDSEMGKSFARIKLRYEDCWANAASMVKEKFIEYGDDIVKSLLKSKKLQSKVFKFTNVFKVVGWVELSIDVVNNVTGLGEESQAKLQLLSMGYEQIWSAENAYAKALEEVKACDPNSDEYSQCLKDFSTSFEYYRLTLERLYSKMAVASAGDKQDYYRYCADKIQKLNLENYENFEIKTFDEYITA